MIPAGYMAKRVEKRPDWLHTDQVVDIYSVSGCNSEDFAPDYIDYWKHNGYWLFDSPEIIKNVAKENSIQLDGTSLFFYEVHELEFDGKNWRRFAPESSFPTNVVLPASMRLEGFDVVTFFAKRRPECSPLSCNSLAEKLPTNSHCLFSSFEEAEAYLNTGALKECERGPYRIFAVYSVDWP
jgi:hypothetical protein